MRIFSGILLSVVLLQLAPAWAQAPKQVVAASAVQKEFDGFLAKFRAALKNNDGAAVAAMTKLPFGYDGDVNDAAQFRAKVYSKTFTAKTRACLQRTKAIYDRHENNDYYSLFCGEEIFLFERTPAGFLFTEIGVND